MRYIHNECVDSYNEMARGLKWLLASRVARGMALCLAAAVAAGVFALELLPAGRALAVEPLALPALEGVAVGAGDQPYWRDETVRPWDNAATVLARMRVSDAPLAVYLANDAAARKLFQWEPGRLAAIAIDTAGRVRTLLLASNDGVVSVVRDDEGRLTLHENAERLEKRTVMATGEIRGSLYRAFKAGNVPDTVVRRLLELFSTEYNFYWGVRKDERFAEIGRAHV